MNGLIPRDFWTFPKISISPMLEELVEETRLDTIPSGLSVSENDDNFYIDAALPGIDPKDVEVTFDRGMLNISGKAKEEEKGKKFYRKATSSFSYHVSVPEGVSSRNDPSVNYKDGMVHASFKKEAASKPKKIEVKVA